MEYIKTKIYKKGTGAHGIHKNQISTNKEVEYMGYIKINTKKEMV